jgi:hypothetical protein
MSITGNRLVIERKDEEDFVFEMYELRHLFFLPLSVLLIILWIKERDVGEQVLVMQRLQGTTADTNLDHLKEVSKAFVVS